MSDQKRKRSFWAFWTTLPGILSGLAALITAVGGLATTIYLITSNNPSPEGLPPTSVTRPTLSTPGDVWMLAGTPALIPTNIAASLPVNPPRPGELQLTPGTTEGDIGPEEKIGYWFQVPDGGRAEAYVEASGGACIHLTLLGPAREQIEESGEECGISGYFAVLADGSSGGTYYLEVKSGSSISAGSYTIDLQSQMQDDAGSGGDAGDTLDMALFLEGRLSQQGLVGSQDQEDYYRFRADANTVLEVQYSMWDQLEVTLSAVESGRVTGEEAIRRDQTVDFSQRPEGDYALRVSNQGSEAIYTIILGLKSGL